MLRSLPASPIVAHAGIWSILPRSNQDGKAPLLAACRWQRLFLFRRWRLDNVNIQPPALLLLEATDDRAGVQVDALPAGRALRIDLDCDIDAGLAARDDDGRRQIEAERRR